jgi:hypothetical protein
MTQRLKYCPILLALLLLTDCLSVDAKAQNKSGDMSVPVKNMLSILDKIDSAPSLSLTSAGEILKVPLQLEAAQSNEYLYIYKGMVAFGRTSNFGCHVVETGEDLYWFWNLAFQSR